MNGLSLGIFDGFIPRIGGTHKFSASEHFKVAIYIFDLRVLRLLDSLFKTYLCRLKKRSDEIIAYRLDHLICETVSIIVLKAKVRIVF